ncbi:hypothetical protein WT71_20040 [Burkholderia stagnalis]|nr:hypothetical protein WT71_20040 [Burkholderia stagnalis]
MTQRVGHDFCQRQTPSAFRCAHFREQVVLGRKQHTMGPLLNDRSQFARGRSDSIQIFAHLCQLDTPTQCTPLHEVQLGIRVNETFHQDR